MARHDYRTVPEELLELADSVEDHFRLLGYRVIVELKEPHYPYTPVFTCKRDETTLIIELDDGIVRDRIDEWVRYCKSCTRDTRIVVCMPASIDISATSIARLRSNGVGYYMVSVASLQEVLPAADLGITIALPSLTKCRARARELLGPAYEQFHSEDWRGGFEDACQTLESAASAYLKSGSRSKRIKIVRKSGPLILSARQIDKLSMGQLATAFAEIQNPAHADKLIGNALATVNPDRVGRTHRRKKKLTETRLRQNVGRHMWTIVSAINEIAKNS